MSVVRAISTAVFALFVGWVQVAQGATFEVVDLSVTKPIAGSLEGEVLYGRLSPGGSWVLKIGGPSGKIADASQHKEAPALTDERVVQLVAESVRAIHEGHGDRLDAIRLQAGSLDPFLQVAINVLREQEVPDSLVVQQKSSEVTALLRAHIEKSELVRSLCVLVVQLGRACRAEKISMNPVAFEERFLGRPWGSVKAEQNSGIKLESLDFVIHLEGI